MMISHSYSRNANDTASYSVGTVVSRLKPRIRNVNSAIPQAYKRSPKITDGALPSMYFCSENVLKRCWHMLYSCLHLATQIPAYLAEHAMHLENVISIPAH